MDRIQYFFGNLLLVDISAAAGSQNAFSVQRFIVHGGYQHEDIIVFSAYFFDQLQAVAVLQGEIDDHQCWFRGFQKPERRIDVDRMSADLQFWIAVDQRGQPAADQVVILDDQHPCFGVQWLFFGFSHIELPVG